MNDLIISHNYSSGTIVSVFPWPLQSVICSLFFLLFFFSCIFAHIWWHFQLFFLHPIPLTLPSDENTDVADATTAWLLFELPGLMGCAAVFSPETAGGWELFFPLKLHFLGHLFQWGQWQRAFRENFQTSTALPAQVLVLMLGKQMPWFFFTWCCVVLSCWYFVLWIQHWIQYNLFNCLSDFPHTPCFLCLTFLKKQILRSICSAFSQFHSFLACSSFIISYCANPEQTGRKFQP